MHITATMVQFMLEQAGHDVKLEGNGQEEVMQLRLLRPGRRQAGTLYLSDASPTPKPKTAAVISPAAKCKANASTLLEASADAMLALQAWDMRLKDALAQSVPLSDFVQLAEDVLPYVLGFYDRNVSVLGASNNYLTWVQTNFAGSATNDLAPGELPPSLLADLFEDDEYLQAATHADPFYFDSRNTVGKCQRSYCVNFFINGAYTARLVVFDAENGEVLHPGAEQLVRHFASYLHECLTRFTGSNVSFGDQHDSLHEWFRSLFFADDAQSQSSLERTLAAYGWSRSDKFTVIKLVFFEAVNWESAALFICGQLERAVRCSCAVHYGRSIAWVVNETLLGQKAADKLVMDTLVDTIRTYACKAGMSDSLKDFNLAGYAFRESEAALSLGQTRDPHQWYYRFGDYALDHVLRKASEDFPPELVAHKGLLKLAAADADDGSEYVATLRCFLECKQNATHAAQALFMHRTSLLRRLERMEKIAGINLDDPDEVLHLQLSLRLLESAGAPPPRSA